MIFRTVHHQLSQEKRYERIWAEIERGKLGKFSLVTARGASFINKSLGS